MSNIYSSESKFDKQGKYFWWLVNEAGWSAERVEMLMLQKYKKSHWNILTVKERSQMIAMLKVYVEKSNTLRAKKYRQLIMSIWSNHGYSKDELHEYMVAWGFGDSLRALELPKLIDVYKYVKVVCGGCENGTS